MNNKWCGRLPNDGGTCIMGGRFVVRTSFEPSPPLSNPSPLPLERKRFPLFGGNRISSSVIGLRKPTKGRPCRGQRVAIPRCHFRSQFALKSLNQTSAASLPHQKQKIPSSGGDRQPVTPRGIKPMNMGLLGAFTVSFSRSPRRKKLPCQPEPGELRRESLNMLQGALPNSSGHSMPEATRHARSHEA